MMGLPHAADQRVGHLREKDIRCPRIACLRTAEFFSLSGPPLPDVQIKEEDSIISKNEAIAEPGAGVGVDGEAPGRHRQDRVGEDRGCVRKGMWQGNRLQDWELGGVTAAPQGKESPTQGPGGTRRPTVFISHWGENATVSLTTATNDPRRAGRRFQLRWTDEVSGQTDQLVFISKWNLPQVTAARRPWGGPSRAPFPTSASVESEKSQPDLDSHCGSPVLTPSVF